MGKKSVLLSYDYELFFGDRSGTVEKTLIYPTYRLLDIMESCGFRGDFFVDWQMLKYMHMQDDQVAQRDYALLEEQLRDIIRRGHRIELHIHPHWVDAKYNGDGTWDFSDFSHYSLNSFSDTEIMKMFEEGTDLLTSIARQVEPNYKLCAFRAGGWAVQPFNILQKAFAKSGIIIESSVMRGEYADKGDSFYDFRSAPYKKTGYYHFFDDVCKEMQDGPFLEVPISCVEYGILYKVISRFYSLLFGHPRCLTDGTHSRARTESSQISHKNISLTLSRVNPINIILNQFRCKTDLSCYIDHPKDFTDNTERAIRTLSKIRRRSIHYQDLVNA